MWVGICVFVCFCVYLCIFVCASVFVCVSVCVFMKPQQMPGTMLLGFNKSLLKENDSATKRNCAIPQSIASKTRDYIVYQRMQPHNLFSGKKKSTVCLTACTTQGQI